MHHQAVCFSRRASEVALASSSLLSKFRFRTVCRGQDRAPSRTFNLQPLEKENGTGRQSLKIPVYDAQLPANNNERTELADIHLLDAKDIIIDDLSATLEAHRDRNKASVIQRINQDVKGRVPFLRPLPDISQTSHTSNETIPGDDVHSTSLTTTLPEEFVDTPEPFKIKRHLTRDQWMSFYWPADAVQLAELTGKIYKPKPSEVMEYKPYLPPTQGAFSVARLREPQRPWLALLGNPERFNAGQSNQRSV